MWLLQIIPPPQTPKPTCELQIQLIDVKIHAKDPQQYVQKDI